MAPPPVIGRQPAAGDVEAPPASAGNGEVAAATTSFREAERESEVGEPREGEERLAETEPVRAAAERVRAAAEGVREAGEHLREAHERARAELHEAGGRARTAEERARAADERARAAEERADAADDRARAAEERAERAEGALRDRETRAPVRVARVSSERPVPSSAVPPAPRPAPVDDGRLNLNEASFDALRSLGLSVSQAARFVAQRAQRGGFSSLDEVESMMGLPRELKAHLKQRGRV